MNDIDRLKEAIRLAKFAFYLLTITILFAFGAIVTISVTRPASTPCECSKPSAERAP